MIYLFTLWHFLIRTARQFLACLLAGLVYTGGMATEDVQIPIALSPQKVSKQSLMSGMGNN